MQGHTALTVLIVGGVTILLTITCVVCWWIGTAMRKGLACFSKKGSIMSDNGFPPLVLTYRLTSSPVNRLAHRPARLPAS